MFGFHINKTSNWNGAKKRAIGSAIVEDIEMANKYIESNVFDCGQIFICGPQSSNFIIDDSDIKNIRDGKYKILVHGSYIDNQWSESSYSIINAKKELDIVTKFEKNGLGVVIHMSKQTNKNYKSVLTSLTNMCNDEERILFLETPSLKPSEDSFETAEKINSLFENIYNDIDLRGLKIGLCVDSAHLAAGGVLLGSYDDAENWFNKLNIKYNRENIPLAFHLNDSYAVPGSGKDEHAALGRGTIWADYIDDIKSSGINSIIQWAKDNNAPAILERSKSKMLLDDFAILKKFSMVKK